MFQNLSDKLQGIFSNLSKKGLLKEADIDNALREIRLALIDADVALQVVDPFIAKVKEQAKQKEIIRSVSPGQQITALVYETLVETLTHKNQELVFPTNPPAVFMMVGLQGSGKTTTTGKIAHYLKRKLNKKVLTASLDVARPAAQEQLRILSEQIEVASLPIIAGELPKDIAQRAMQAAKLGGYDVLLLDTAGRLHIDDALMQELEDIKKITSPGETLLVTDAMLGNDAVVTAQNFHKRISLSGIVLTRVDGDSKGGAALSTSYITGCPIKFLGTGEKIDDLDTFEATRIVGRLFGHGDVALLVQKASEELEQEENERIAKRMQKGLFDLNDMLSQLRQMKKMGGMDGILSLLPGMGKIKQMAAGAMDDGILKKQEAIILSMTPQERKNPNIIHAARKKRISSGSGVSIQEINKLLKQWLQMSKMMKKMGRLDKRGMEQSLKNLLGGGGRPPLF